MIGLLVHTALATPQFELESQSYLYTTSYWEQRTLGSFSLKQDSWNSALRILHESSNQKHQLLLQGWELYYTKRNANWTLNVGNQVTRWGQLDILSDLNAINGVDQRFGPTIKPQWAYIPAASAHLTYKRKDWNASFTWLPFSARDSISWLGTPWGIISNEQADTFLGEAQTWSGDLITESLMRDILASVQKTLPNAAALFPQEQRIDYGDIGLRIGKDSIAYSSHIYASWMHSRRPLARLNAELVRFMKEERLPNSLELGVINEILEEPIQVSYPRQLLVGMDLSTTLSIFGFRAEGCFVSDKVRPMAYMQGSTRPYLSGSFALDYPFDMNIIMIETKVFSVLEPVANPWLEANQSIQIAGIGQFALPYSFQLQLTGQYDTALGDGLLQGVLSRRLTENWNVSMQAMMLHGPESDNPFTYSSGILGQWREYDHLSLRIHWNP